MAETFLAVEQSADTGSVLMRLKQELLCQIRGCKVPEMIAAYASKYSAKDERVEFYGIFKGKVSAYDF